MTSPATPTPDRPARFGGWLDGLIGMTIFSASLPATRVAVQGFDPLFLTVARAAIAGVLAVGLLRFTRSRCPARRDLAGLAYVSVFSMLVGFIFWRRGLAHGGVAAVGQLQLVQPFLALILAATLLGEAVSPAMLLVLAGVVVCVAGARRFAARPSPVPPISVTVFEIEEVLP